MIDDTFDLYRFGRKPKQGLAYLQERGLVGTSVDEIAEFLMTEERLDKAVVGDYLGDGDAYAFHLFVTMKKMIDICIDFAKKSCTRLSIDWILVAKNSSPHYASFSKDFVCPVKRKRSID
jgi:hypothetical protein